MTENMVQYTAQFGRNIWFNDILLISIDALKKQLNFTCFLAKVYIAFKDILLAVHCSVLTVWKIIYVLLRNYANLCQVLFYSLGNNSLKGWLNALKCESSYKAFLSFNWDLKGKWRPRPKELMKLFLTLKSDGELAPSCSFES